jgi:hypothetical protein
MSTIIENLIPYFKQSQCEYWIEEYGYLAEIKHPKKSEKFFVL